MSVLNKTEIISGVDISAGLTRVRVSGHQFLYFTGRTGHWFQQSNYSPLF